MFPLLLIAAIINIIAKNNNYYINTPKNGKMDIRVKRDASIDFDSILLERIVNNIRNEELTFNKFEENISFNENINKHLNGNNEVYKDEENIIKKKERNEHKINSRNDNLRRNIYKIHRKKRNASIGSGITKFFNNLYNKIYGMSHSDYNAQTDKSTYNSNETRLSKYTNYDYNNNNIRYNQNNQPYNNYIANNNFQARSHTNDISNSYNSNNPNNYNQYNLNPNYTPYNSYTPKPNLNSHNYSEFTNYYKFNNQNNYNGYHENNNYNGNNENNNYNGYNEYNNYNGYNENNNGFNQNNNNKDYNENNKYNGYNQNNNNNNGYSYNDLGVNVSSTTEMVINEAMIFGGTGCPKNYRRVAFVCTPKGLHPLLVRPRVRKRIQ